MSYYMFIDDERFPPDDGIDWVICRNIHEVTIEIAKKGYPKHISFDHDLGEFTQTGYDIVKSMVEIDMFAREVYQVSDVKESSSKDFMFPEDFTYYVHSQNPVGRDNIVGLLEPYLKSVKIC